LNVNKISESKEQVKMPVDIKFIHIRHSTSVIEIGNVKILIDPMLSDKESLPPVLLTGNKLKNPGKALPFSLDTIINDLDYLLLTHLHFDHFDKKAIEIIPKTKTVLCSPKDSKKLHEFGFLQTQAINGSYEMDGIIINRYPAVHGKGVLKNLMGKGSSYSINYNGFKLFLTGDSILTKTLITNLVEEEPHLIIANAGAAKFRFGKRITMSIKDVQEISKILKNSKIVVVHLDTLNHCTESRDYCKEQLLDYSNIIIPDYGENILIN